MYSASGKIITPKGVLPCEGRPGSRTPLPVILSNIDGQGASEIIFDYGTCQGGIPVFTITSASGPVDRIPFRVTYSETREGIDHEKGDGPFFLFSNAMDSYRSCLHEASRGTDTQTIEVRLNQYSQRYQKISLVLPETSLTFSNIGFRKVRSDTPVKSTFSCSDPLLNSIWRDGVRTLDLCTVRKGETRPAWDVMPEGTRVFGGHWAPCRKGTSWTDKTVTFVARIEKGGASWGVRMVANGLVLCLDADARTLTAVEGLSNTSSLLPVVPRGSWPVSLAVDLSGWFSVRTVVRGESVNIFIGEQAVAEIADVRIRPLLTGDRVNTGSVAFGGPEGWVTMYKSIKIADPDGKVLYQNDMLAADADRVHADFQVGSNPLACTVDGAKRDRACFGGDVFVMGRSLAYSTADFEAWRGSIELLASHQTADGYLGNLCSIQAPQHEGEDEPPTYAFYSLTYALLLAVSVRDYWMHSGDWKTVERCYPKLEKLVRFAETFSNSDGLLEAPPGLQMTWFPMGGPVMGVSSGVNVAYYDALSSMAEMSRNDLARPWYTSRAKALKEAISKHMWNSETGILRLGNSLPSDGFCQDINGYAISRGIVPHHPRTTTALAGHASKLPPAFQGMGHWDKFGVTSPYASGFAAEALFSMNEGPSALGLLRRVWGLMSDPSSADYSGAHWEAMKVNGTPFNHDVSLAHGWSTWPVALLPRYLAGLRPLSPGWTNFGVEPVFAGLEHVEASMETPAGKIEVAIVFASDGTRGTLTVLAPPGSMSTTVLPPGWVLEGPSDIDGTGQPVTQSFRKMEA